MPGAPDVCLSSLGHTGLAAPDGRDSLLLLLVSCPALSTAGGWGGRFPWRVIACRIVPFRGGLEEGEVRTITIRRRARIEFPRSVPVAVAPCFSEKIRGPAAWYGWSRLLSEAPSWS